jgi:hypothetical protein
MAEKQYIIHTPALIPGGISAGCVLPAVCDITHESMLARIRKLKGINIGDTLSLKGKKYEVISTAPDGKSHIKVLADATE